MEKSAKRLLGVVFTLALMTILACGAFAAKPAVELTDVYFTVDAFDGVSPTVCFRNNSNKTIKYVTFTLVPLNAVGDRTSCTISTFWTALPIPSLPPPAIPWSKSAPVWAP